jgi:serine/threonine-protein kinase
MTQVPFSEPLLVPGTTLGTTYTVEAFLGAGAFGQVYRVTHRYLGRQALKVFPPGGLDPARDFFHEARVLVALTHPNIIRIFDANVVETAYGTLPYLAMEYIEGETIGHLLQRRVRLSLSEANALAEDLCAGLSEAHRLEPPLLHLDLTTENILVTEQGGRLHAKIADFGLAAQVHPTTRMARARGTFYFMAPEMFWGYATPASDVYMLGFIMYWLYAGLPPYPVPTLPEGASAQDFADAIQRSRDTPAPPLTRFRLDIPAAMTELIAKALSPDPNQRFPNAMMFSAALRGV